MSNLYGTSQIASIEEMANSEELQRLFLLDDVLSGSYEQIKEFTESEEGAVLMEKVALDKKIIDRATMRKMDLHKRIVITAFFMAKQAKSADWAKLVKYTKLKKQFKNKILNKFGKKAERVAKIAQKNYIKNSRKSSAKSDDKK